MARTEEEINSIMEQFVEALNRAIGETFGPEGFPPDLSTVTGVKFDDEDGCHTFSNLNICGVPGALNEMLSMAMADHQRYHAEGLHQVTEMIPPESVPADVREVAERVAEQFGAENIIYTETVDTEDLDRLPEFIDGGELPGGLETMRAFNPLIINGGVHGYTHVSDGQICLETEDGWRVYPSRVRCDRDHT
jgi:hypothetical protein